MFNYDYVTAKKSVLYIVLKVSYDPASNYMFKVNNINTRTRRSGIFIVNFEHISHLVLVFLLLTLSR